jgi:hypothetical protein
VNCHEEKFNFSFNFSTMSGQCRALGDYDVYDNAADKEGERAYLEGLLGDRP